MAVAGKPIYESDITATGRPDAPVWVETKSANLDRPLAHGWLTGAVVQQGFQTFAARYDSHVEYSVTSISDPGFYFVLNLGEGQRASMSGGERYLPNGSFVLGSLVEPKPLKMHRGERKHLERCGIALGSEWIESGIFERFDDRGIIRRILARPDLLTMAVAPPALLSVASRLFGAFNFDGPMAKLRLEAAALAFFAEAFASADRMESASRVENARIMRVKDLLDSLTPDADVRLFDLATQHYMGVRTLCRHFRQTFGTTIVEYVAQRRMEAASVALQHEGATIEQAAFIAGFAHASNFSRAFRRRYGYPPSHARSGYRNNALKYRTK